MASSSASHFAESGSCSGSYLNMFHTLRLTAWRSPAGGGAAGQVQRRVRPLRSRRHGPMRTFPGLGAVTEVHVHERLVGQRHLTRQSLEVIDGLLVQADRELALEPPRVRIPDRG